MRIDWWTLALQAANFLVLVWLLQHFLYRPVLGIIAERQQRTDAVIAEADAAKAATERLRAELEQQFAGIAKEREQALEEAHARAEAEAAALLARARDDAEKLLAQERRRIEQERVDAALALRQDAIELGLTVARRLLTDASAGDLEAPFLARAISSLQRLSDSERRDLVGQLSDGEAVQVVTARPLEPAARDALRNELRELLRPEIVVEFVEDPTIIAGAELHFPHTILRYSWQNSLQGIEEELKRNGRTAGHA